MGFEQIAANIIETLGRLGGDKGGDEGGTVEGVLARLAINSPYAEHT